MKIISIIILFLISNVSFGQNIPRYHIESGDTVGIILSIQQAQKIYNQQLLLDAYRSYKYGSDSLIKKLYQISSKYEESQIYNKTLMEQHNKMFNSKEIENIRLNDKITNLNTNLALCNLQNQNLQNNAQDYKKIIDDLNTKNKYLFGGAIGFGAITLFLLGMISSK